MSPSRSAGDADGYLEPRETMSLGSFPVRSGYLHLTDPAFSVLTMGIVVDDVAYGNWIAEAAVSPPIPGWGRRVIELRAYTLHAPDLEWVQLPREVGVDSAQAGIADGAPADAGDSFEFATVVANGVVAWSGFGDGGYKAFAARQSGKVVAVKIVFITDESAREHAEDDA